MARRRSRTVDQIERDAKAVEYRCRGLTYRQNADWVVADRDLAVAILFLPVPPGTRWPAWWTTTGDAATAGRSAWARTRPGRRPG